MHNLACKSLAVQHWPTIDHSPISMAVATSRRGSPERFHSRHVLAGHSFAEMKFLERSYLTAVRAETSCISLYFMYLIHSCEFHPDVDPTFMNFFPFLFLLLFSSLHPSFRSLFRNASEGQLKRVFTNFTCIPTLAQTYIAFLLESFLLFVFTGDFVMRFCWDFSIHRSLGHVELIISQRRTFVTL